MFILQMYIQQWMSKKHIKAPDIYQDWNCVINQSNPIILLFLFLQSLATYMHIFKVYNVERRYNY